MTERAQRELLEGLGGEVYTEAVEHGRIEADDPSYAEGSERAAAREDLVRLGLLRYDEVAAVYLPCDPTATSDRIVVPLAQQGSRLLRDSAQWHDVLARLGQVWRSGGGNLGGAMQIHSLDAINEFIEAQVMRCTEELLTAQPYGRRKAADLASAEDRDRAALERGVHMRTLYQHSARQSPATREYVAEMAAFGAEVRTLDEFFKRLLVFDRQVALIPGSANHAVAVAVTDRSIVEYLVDIFERSWERALPFTVEHQANRTVADDVRAMALRMLVEGHSDAASAKRMGVSPRTYATYISSLKQEYGVQTRFQLAWAISRARDPAGDLDERLLGAPGDLSTDLVTDLGELAPDVERGAADR